MSVKKYLPVKKEIDTIAVQAKIDPALAERCKKIMDREGFTWTQVIAACLENFVDECATTTVRRKE